MINKTDEKVADSASVSAILNYSVETGQRPYLVNEDYSQNRLFLEPVEMRILDGGDLATPPDLEVEGIACRTHDIDISDLADSEEARQHYSSEMKSFMLDLTGADTVVMLHPPSLRRQTVLGATDLSEAPPAAFVYCDYSWSGSGLDYGAHEELSRPGIRRTVAYNQWRLLSPGPTNSPLALCDARTLAAEDVITGDSRFVSITKSHETTVVRHSPAHRWIYFPRLTSGEVLVFKQSDSDPEKPRMVPHSAFIDKSCPESVAPRVSTETRCVAVWYD